MRSLIAKLRDRVSAFRQAQGGNVAIIFTVALIPIIGLVGGTIDYSRASAARAAMQAALDATALAVSKQATTLTQSELEQKAAAYFKAAFDRPEVQNVTIGATYSTSGGSSVTISANGDMGTTFLGVLGIDSMQIGSSAKTKWGMTRVRVALVLDNTGSMASAGKMDSLKTATKSLLTQLKNAVVTTGDAYVSIIPFVKDVNADPSNYNANWIDWTDWDNNNGWCTGYSSPWKPSNKNSCVGAGGKWHVNQHSTWNGCITDRGTSSGPSTGNYDTNVTAPTPSNPAILFPAEQYGSCPKAVMGLNYDWSSMNTLVDSMTPKGTTNQAIGLAWGWLSLAGGGPFTVPPKDPAYQYTEVIILLSDGLNTADRWYTSASAIDARQKMTCDNVKAAGITIYTIQVNTGGDPVSSVLQNCASSSDKFFYLTSAAQISGVFDQIGTKLSKLRIAQ